MRLLLTVADPDDESFGCGSLLAACDGARHRVRGAVRNAVATPANARPRSRPKHSVMYGHRNYATRPASSVSLVSSSSTTAIPA